MAKILYGSEVASAIYAELSNRVAALARQGVVPTLAIVRMRDCADDIAYERGLVKSAARAGVQTKLYTLSEQASQSELLAQIDQLNGDENVHGILILRPLPEHISDEQVRRAVLPKKDVDGITDVSLAGVFSGTEQGFPPCTAEACVAILDHYRIPCAGKRAVVIGRSLVVGKPAAMLLLARNATVTVCHSKTPDLSELAKQADLLIVAAGRMGLVGQVCFREGQTVLDVGIHFDADGRMCGDVQFDAALPIVDAITPVPGGVGAVTTALMFSHTVAAAERGRKGYYGRAQE